MTEITIEMRQISIEIRDDTIEIRQISIEIRDNSIEMRQISIEKRDNTIEIRQISIEKCDNTIEIRQISIEKCANTIEIRQLSIEIRDNMIEMRDTSIIHWCVPLKTRRNTIGSWPRGTAWPLGPLACSVNAAGRWRGFVAFGQWSLGPLVVGRGQQHTARPRTESVGLPR